MSKKLTAIVVGALVLAATAISPALGGPSLNQMVKDEVAKVAKKKKAKPGPRGPAGPTGPAGAAGAQGAQGIPGTARAYARMDNPCGTSSTCTIDHAKGISSIRHTATGGLYCATAPGISQSDTSWFAVADNGDSGAGAGTETALPNSNNAGCNSTEFEVQTLREDAGVTDIAFFIMIP